MIFITVDLPINQQAQLYLCSGSIVMLQIASKWRFFIKRPLFQELTYIKLLFNMFAEYYTDV